MPRLFNSYAAFETAIKIIEYIDEYECGGFGDRVIKAIETADLAEDLKSRDPARLERWYDKLTEMLEDEEPEEEIEEMRWLLDEWRETK